jgi:hypothetical protein
VVTFVLYTVSVFTDSITALELWHDSYSHTIAKNARIMIK